MLPSKGSLNPEQIEYVRKCVNERCDEQGLSYEQIDNKLGCGRKATRRFMEGNYDHSESNFARKLDNWLKNSDPNLGGMPRAFVSTEVADNMIGIIKQVYQRRSMGVIVGPAGVSKTTVLKYIAAGRIAGSMHIELTSTEKTIVQVLRRLSAELGLNDQYHAQRLMQNIIKNLRGTDRLLLIDEAHYANKQALNALRDVHKQTGCPIMLVGTREITESVNDFDAFRGQMKSLISMHYDISIEANESGNPLYSVDDIINYAGSMGIKLTIDGASRVAELSSQLGWGGLRSAAYLMLNASMAVGGKPLTERHINRTLRQMEGYEGYLRTDSRVQSSRKVAVA
jgi:DNA transposition AAA+ family ATPase